MISNYNKSIYKIYEEEIEKDEKLVKENKNLNAFILGKTEKNYLHSLFLLL